jgi:hypothetical protein
MVFLSGVEQRVISIAQSMVSGDSLPRQALLRSDDAAECVAAGQHDAAMIDFLWRRSGVDGWRNDVALDQGSAAGWAPVGLCVRGEYGMAMAAGAFHV